MMKSFRFVWLPWSLHWFKGKLTDETNIISKNDLLTQNRTLKPNMKYFKQQLTSLVSLLYFRTACTGILNATPGTPAVTSPVIYVVSLYSDLTSAYVTKRNTGNILYTALKTETTDILFHSTLLIKLGNIYADNK